jgi:hypothetical protein
MTGGEWSDEENAAIVAEYFVMLAMELSRQSFNKAERNRGLEGLIGRGRGSTEYKHQNISAILMGLDEFLSRSPIAPMCRRDIHPFFGIGPPPSGKGAPTWKNKGVDTISINDGKFQFPPKRSACDRLPFRGLVHEGF